MPVECPDLIQNLIPKLRVVAFVRTRDITRDMPRQFRFTAAGPVHEIPDLFPVGAKRKNIEIYELAELSGISISTLRDWVRKGKIKGAFQSGVGGKWRFRRELVEKWWIELLTRHLAVKSVR